VLNSQKILNFLFRSHIIINPGIREINKKDQGSLRRRIIYGELESNQINYLKKVHDKILTDKKIVEMPKGNWIDHYLTLKKEITRLLFQNQEH
jgi:hypothetical protein